MYNKNDCSPQIISHLLRATAWKINERENPNIYYYRPAENSEEGYSVITFLLFVMPIHLKILSSVFTSIPLLWGCVCTCTYPCAVAVEKSGRDRTESFESRVDSEEDEYEPE